MSTFLRSPLLSSPGRFFGCAGFSLALLLAASSLAHAQATDPNATDAGAAGNGAAAGGGFGGGGGGGRGGRRGGGGGNFNGGAAAAGGAVGVAGVGGGGFAGGGGRGGRGVGGVGGRGGRGGFAGAAGAATDASAITTMAVTAVDANGAPVAPNPNVIGAVGPNPLGPGNPQGTTTVNAVPDPNQYISVNMPGNSAQEVLDWLQRNTGKIVYQAQNLPQVRIIFSTTAGTNTALPRGEAVTAIIGMLALNGIIVTPLGEHALKAEIAGSYLSKGVDTLPEGGLNAEPTAVIYGHFFHLEYISADNAALRIQPFLNPNATAISYAKENTIFVADSLVNIQHVAEALKHLDEPVVAQDEIIYLPLKNARAADVATSLTALSGNVLAKYFTTTTGGSPDTVFTSDQRTNSIVVVTNKGNRAIVKSLVDQFDTDIDPTTKTQVYFLKQSLAQDMVTLLRAIVSGVQSAVNANRGGGNAGGGAAAGGAAAAGPAGAGTASRDQQFSQYVTIQSDTRTNSIVAYGTPSDLRQISTLIDDVDVVLPQVHIDVIVTEVTLSKDQVSGLSSFGINYGFIPGTGATPPTTGGAKTYSVTGPTAQNGVTSPALSISGSLTNWDLNTVFNVARVNSSVRVLSNPSLTITHSQVGSITVGQRIPTITSTSTNISGGDNITSTVAYQQVAIQLQVQPRIGKDGSVYMQIQQEVDDVVGQVAVNGNNQPIIGQRTVNTFVTVHDGDVLVLGGLRKRNVSASHGVMFLLGEIPILGQLFQPDVYDSTSDELIVFIRPTIVKGSNDASDLTRELQQNSQAADMSLQYLHDHKLDGSEPYSTNPNIHADATPGPSPEHAPQPRPATTPVPAPVSEPVSAASISVPAASPAPAEPAPAPTVVATAPVTAAPAETSSAAPASSPVASGSTQQNAPTRGFNK